MRELDSDGVQKSSVFADTIDGVIAEAGDIIQPINNGEINQEHIKAELADLCSDKHPGRVCDDEITLFKSVGTAFEDLVTARLAFKYFQSNMNNKDSNKAAPETNSG